MIEYSDSTPDVYKDDMIADISGNKKLNQVVTELFIKGIKLNISTVFITQTYLPAPKDIRQNFAQDLL